MQSSSQSFLYWQSSSSATCGRPSDCSGRSTTSSKMPSAGSPLGSFKRGRPTCWRNIRLDASEFQLWAPTFRRSYWGFGSFHLTSLSTSRARITQERLTRVGCSSYGAALWWDIVALRSAPLTLLPSRAEGMRGATGFTFTRIDGLPNVCPRASHSTRTFRMSKDQESDASCPLH
jgi:hypothetical protein